MVQRVPQYDNILDDPTYERLLDEAQAGRPVLELILAAIRQFHTLNDVENGLGGTGPTLRKFASSWGRTRSERSAVSRVVRGMTQLYRRHRASDVRGMLLEGLVFRRLVPRYAGADCELHNNAKFRLENGASYTSGDRSIDVIGFDGSAGECHDCKIQARRFEADWATELVGSVIPLGFRVGLVTADSEAVAWRHLREKGIDLAQVTVLTSESLWRAAPLQVV